MVGVVLTYDQSILSPLPPLLVPRTVMVGNVQKKSLRMVQLAVYNRTETGLDINYTIQPQWRRKSLTLYL